MENKEELIIKNLDGKDIRLFVIDIIEDQQTNKQYIYYTIEDDEEVYVSSLIQNENIFSLSEVSDIEKNILLEVLKNGRSK